MKRSNLILLAVGAVAAIAYPHIFSLPFPRHLMIMVFIYATLGSAWNLIGGYAGQVSLGNAVYFGLGAYTSTILLMKVGISPWLGIFAGIMISTLHQSSLGTMWLITPEKLHPLWYTPLLPILFFISAVAVGPLMLILGILIIS